MQQSDYILGKGKYFLFSKAPRRALRPAETRIQLASQAAAPEVKRPELTSHFPLVLRLSILIARNHALVQLHLTTHGLTSNVDHQIRTPGTIRPSPLSLFNNTSKTGLRHQIRTDYWLIKLYFCSVKLNVSLSMPWFYTVYRHSPLTSSLDGGDPSACRLSRLTPGGGGDAPYLMSRRLGGTRSQSARSGEKKNFLPAGNRTTTLFFH